METYYKVFRLFFLCSYAVIQFCLVSFLLNFAYIKKKHAM